MALLRTLTAAAETDGASLWAALNDASVAALRRVAAKAEKADACLQAALSDASVVALRGSLTAAAETEDASLRAAYG